MEVLLSFLSLFTLIILIVGIIKPSSLEKIFKKEFTRKKVLIYFGSTTIILFILFGIISEPENKTVTTENIERVELKQQNEKKQETETIESEGSEDNLVTEGPDSLNTFEPESPQQLQEEFVEESEQIQQPQPETYQTQCENWQININTASIEEMYQIIHIDEIRAEELINLRPFTSVDSMTRINGIGPSRINDIKAQGLACF